MTGTVSTGHSLPGMASFAASVVPGALLAGAYLLVLALVNAQPPDADETAYAFGMAALRVLTVLGEVIALGLEAAGALQRQRKRTFAFLGSTCAALVLAAIQVWVGLGGPGIRCGGIHHRTPAEGSRRIAQERVEPRRWFRGCRLPRIRSARSS